MKKLQNANPKSDCAIIPAYNEERTIKEVVERIRKSGLQPIVVDDASKDNTYKVAKSSGAIVLRKEKNMGKGEALKTGLEYILKAKPKVNNIVFIDADLQYFPEEAGSLLEPLKSGNADIVMGYRDWSKVPFRHKLGNFVWRCSFNILFGTKMLDTNCGYMAARKESARKIREALHGGYIIENAILSHAVKNNLRIVQVPVKVSYRHKSAISRGVRMVSGITFFILVEGLKYRISKL